MSQQPNKRINVSKKLYDTCTSLDDVYTYTPFADLPDEMEDDSTQEEKLLL